MSQSTTLSLGKAVPNGRAGLGLSRWLSVAILVLMGLAGAMLLGRRWVGALEQPLTIGTLASLGILLAGAALLVRWAWCREERSAAVGRIGRFVTWCPTILILPIAAAVCLSGTSTVGIVSLWSILLLEEFVWGLWKVRRHKRSEIAPLQIHEPDSVQPMESRAVESVPLNEPTIETLDADVADAVDSAVDLTEDEAVVQTLPNSQITQQFVRSHSAEGDDLFSGWLRLAIPPGGRTTNVHVAFCPPFAHAPAVEVHQVDGPTGRVKAMQSLSYGARFDFKLSRSSEEATTVLLRFVAKLTDG